MVPMSISYTTRLVPPPQYQFLYYSKKNVIKLSKILLRQENYNCYILL